MALDKNDQMSGGKTAAGSKSAAAGAKTGGAGSGNKSSGGKMGASSSQSGGVKSGGAPAGGKMGASSSQSGGTKSGNTSKGSMGVASGKMGAASTQKSGGGGLQGVAAQSRALADKASGGLLGGVREDRMPSKPAATGGLLGGLTTTPRSHPFRDPNRFSFAGSVAGPDAIANALSLSGMSRLANLQSAYGKPMTITSGYRSPAYNAKVGGAKRSQHMAHKAVDIGVPSADRAKVAQLAKDMGFTGIGTYSGPFSRNMVHTDLGPARSWGAVATNALRGYQPNEPDMEAIAAGMRTPTYGSPSLSAAASQPSTFPGRPDFPGAFPAEDRRPSEFPGRPSPQTGFNSQIASRPDPSQQFSSQIGGRPEMSSGFNSMIAGRPETVGSGFPTAFASDFPSRPAPQPGFASQVAARPDPQQGFMSAMAGKPDFQGAFPGAPVTANFPGRPGTPPQFNSQIAARPGLPQNFNSQVAGRPEFPGSLPAAGSYENPGKSFAGIPGSGFPQAPPQQGGGFFAGLADAATPSPQNPPRSFANIPQGGLYAAQDDGSFINRMMGATGVPAPGNDLRDVQGGQTPLEWTGSEPPQVVAQMQQHVEEVLRQYLGTAPAGVA